VIVWWGYVEGIVGLQSGYSGVTGEWGEGLNFVNT